MSNRTILIIAGLAIPVVALAILTQSAPPPKSNTTVAAKASMGAIRAKAANKQTRLESLSDAQSRVASRLQVLNKMAQADWDRERKNIMKRNPNAAPPDKLEEARERTKTNLERLKGLTEEQWAAEAKDYRDKQNKEAQADTKEDKPL